MLALGYENISVQACTQAALPSVDPAQPLLDIHLGVPYVCDIRKDKTTNNRSCYEPTKIIPVGLRSDLCQGVAE